jgi:tRNA A37 threonylcarbamoyladenosine dehydratase
LYKATLDRQIRLIGEDATSLLQSKTVAVFGLGGVGSYAVEALARAGVGKIIVCDGDVVDVTNVNRQLYALTSTVGQSKTELAKARILDINPDAEVVCYNTFFNSETLHQFDFKCVDYIVDCIDTVTSKILLVEVAKSLNKPIIACLGTGNKLDPTAFKVADIYKTKMCPLFIINT